MESIIEAFDLCKTYKLGEVSIEVLKDVNLAIDQGEYVSLMGPSGSGKSTLLYLLGGLDKPTSGSIKLKGRELSVMKDKEESEIRRREIGFVFQFYNLVPNLNLEENIMLPILLDGKNLKQNKSKLDEILELVGLEDRRKHTPRELSGGQQQRAAIARALVNEPDIILADEPTGNLDSKTGRSILELFKRISKEKNMTIVQVTHSSEAAQYGSRVINVKDGRVWE